MTDASTPADGTVAPDPPRPRGDYRSAVAAGGLVFSAGATPRRDGVLVARGLVGADVDPATAADAAGLAARNAWAACVHAVRGPVTRAVRMTVFVACVDGFTELSAVADGASRALLAWLDEAALPARSAVGVRSLPGGAPVEVELVVVDAPTGR